MQKFIKWLIKIFLNNYELKSTDDIENLESRLDASIFRENHLLDRLRNQLNVTRHLEQIVEQHNRRGFMEQMRNQPETTIRSNDSIYKNFGKRSNILRVIKSPTKNCQWICIHNVQSLISNDDAPKLIEEFTKYGDKKMVLVDVEESKVKDIKKVFKKTHNINFEKPYENSNGSSMVIIMFRLKDKYYKKWVRDNSFWRDIEIAHDYHFNEIRRSVTGMDLAPPEIKKSKPISWKQQTQGLQAYSWDIKNKRSNKYEKQSDETEEDYTLRMKKLKQEEHKQRMKGFNSSVNNNINDYLSKI